MPEQITSIRKAGPDARKFRMINLEKPPIRVLRNQLPVTDQPGKIDADPLAKFGGIRPEVLASMKADLHSHVGSFPTIRLPNRIIVDTPTRPGPATTDQKTDQAPAEPVIKLQLSPPIVAPVRPDHALSYQTSDQTPDTPDAQIMEDLLTVAPQDEYHRVHVKGEEKARKKILEGVYVQNGIAHGINSDGIRTKLIALRIDGDKNAHRVDFRLGRDIDGEKTIELVLPGDEVSRIGFFLAYDSPTHEVSATVRAGLYPGKPLIAEIDEKKKQENIRQTGEEGQYIDEFMLGLGGIKTHEEEEMRWARQIGLDALGFDEAHRRGIFNKTTRRTGDATWTVQPFHMTPPKYDELLEHYNRQDVQGNTMQINFYSESPISNTVSSNHSSSPQMSLSYGLGLGFGNATQREGSTTQTGLKELVGAFRVVAVPAD